MSTSPRLRHLAALTGSATAALLGLSVALAPTASANSFYKACGPNNNVVVQYIDGRDLFLVNMNVGNTKVHVVLTPAQSWRGPSFDFRYTASFAFHQPSRSLAYAYEDSLYDYKVTCTHPNGKGYTAKGSFYS